MNVNLNDGFLINPKLSANGSSSGDISMTNVVKSFKFNEQKVTI